MRSGKEEMKKWFAEMESAKGEIEKKLAEMKSKTAGIVERGSGGAKRKDWASPEKLDTQLSDFSLIFEIFRSHTTNGRMTTVTIVINLNKLKEFSFSLNSG